MDEILHDPPYVTRVRRLVIELPAPLEFQCCVRIWMMQDFGHSRHALSKHCKDSNVKIQGWRKSDAGFRPSTVWRLASFRKLWSLVTADQSQLPVREGRMRGPGIWYFQISNSFP